MTTATTKATLALDFVIFYVSDLAATSKYLTEKIGFSFDSEGSGPNFQQLWGKEGTPGIGLIGANEQTPAAGSVKLYFKTDDIADTHSTIITRGVELGPIVQMPFGKIFDVPMPDNFLVSMLS